MRKLVMTLSAVVVIATSFYRSPDSSTINSENKSKKIDTISTGNIPAMSEEIKNLSTAEILYSSLDFNENQLKKTVFDKAFQGFEN